MTNEELDKLDQCVGPMTVKDSVLHDLISLSRIGLAAVEKHQVPNLSDPDLEGREYLERFDKVSAAWDKLNRLIDAYLARKDG